MSTFIAVNRSKKHIVITITDETDAWDFVGMLPTNDGFSRELARVVVDLWPEESEREAAGGPLLDHWAECPLPPDGGCEECHEWFTTRASALRLAAHEDAAREALRGDQ